MPVAPFMDREKVTKPTAQIGFIKFVLIPMFETVAKVILITRKPRKCRFCSIRASYKCLWLNDSSFEN